MYGLKWHVPKCQLLAGSNINQKGFTYSFTKLAFHFTLDYILYNEYNALYDMKYDSQNRYIQRFTFNSPRRHYCIAAHIFFDCSQYMPQILTAKILLNIQQSNVFSVDINNPRKTICVPASCKLLCVKQHGHLTTFAWCEFSYNKV